MNLLLDTHILIWALNDDPRLPENLYVADTTILPKAMGNPPILSIMALAKKMASML